MERYEKERGSMRDYKVESIEAKYREDIEKLGQYAVIIPLDKEDLGAYIEGFDTMKETQSNEICREIINLLEFEMIMMNNKIDTKGNRFMFIVKECVKKVCRMNGLKFKNNDDIFLLGEGSA